MDLWLNEKNSWLNEKNLWLNGFMEEWIYGTMGDDLMTQLYFWDV